MSNFKKTCTVIILIEGRFDSGKKSLFSTEVSLCRRDTGEKEKAGAQGTMGKRRSEACCLFFDYCIFFIGMPSGSLCGGERQKKKAIVQNDLKMFKKGFA